ncbi:retrotransposon protein, putative, ty1-copia subclass, partial [Tanacetum coccineum]
MLQDVKSYLGRSFTMKDLGDVAYILGIKIYHDRSKRLIGLCQSAYIEKILKRYYMENSKRGTIPMQEKLKLSKSQGASTLAEKQRMQNVPYTSAIGSIMYVVRCTRPDVAFAQNITSQFQQNPGEEHWTCRNTIKDVHTNAREMQEFEAAAKVATHRLLWMMLQEKNMMKVCSRVPFPQPSKDHGLHVGSLYVSSRR